MNNFWKILNKKRIEYLSKKLVKSNSINKINAIENAHYNHVRDIFFALISTEVSSKQISILDYGSNILTISNIQNKIDCKKMRFDIFDPHFQKGIYKHSHIKYIKFKITNNFNDIISKKYNIINFGSSIQYEKNIFKKLSLLNLSSSKYVLISSTPLSVTKSYYSQQKGKKNVIQYIHSFNKIVKFFNKKNFKLIFKSRNDKKNIACKKIKFKTHSLNLIFKNAK